MTIPRHSPTLNYRITIENEVEKKTLSFSKSLISIGSASQDDIVLESKDFSIARSHAILEFQGGDFYLTPTGINGTFLNKKELELKKAKQVHPGDELRIMNYMLRIEFQQ